MKDYSIFLFFIFIFLIFVWQGIFLPKDINSLEEKLFSIEKGESFFRIAQNLEKENLIQNQFYFETHLIFKNQFGKLKAGEYLLSPSMTIPEIAQKIVSGDVIKEKITIVEGWNKREIVNYLEERGIMRSEDFLENLKHSQWKNRYDFLKEETAGNFYDRTKHQQMEEWDVEGFLFPDTYFVEKGILPEKIISKMLDNFDKKLKPELREEISRQEKTIFEIVTMASMIEKEVKTPEDKKLVSGILWKRLENGISLQVDATISYITGKKTVKIPLEDFQIDSPYNTYKYKGLPLGPICNPGLDSIRAAIEPEYSDYWYYLSTPEGKTIFSKTLEEHNLAKSKYLR